MCPHTPRSPEVPVDPTPLPTGSESAEIDSWAISSSGVPSPALMERAGAQAAHLIATALGLPPAGHAIVLAGSGDNGGDARIVARCLGSWGWRVELLETAADPRSATLTRGRLRPESVADSDDEHLAARLAAADVLVDGMLGTGASGELRGEVLRAARGVAACVDHARPLVVALDVPTGVNADRGDTVPSAIRADATIAFGWPKLGTLLHPGRAHSGRILAVEIGFPPLSEAGAPTVTWSMLSAGWASSCLPVRSPDTHKNAAGAVLVVAGSEGMAGAAILAGRAALRTGAGYLRVASVASNRHTIQAALPEAVWVDRSDADELCAALAASGAIVVGPGMGTDDDAGGILTAVLQGGVPSIVDADALTLLAAGEVAPLPPGSVLTPHPGEAARLLGTDAAAVQADRLQAIETLLERFGPEVTVLLKGSPSLVAGAHRRLDPSGSSDLATAGMGDVLAGTIGALIAQGVTSEEAASLGLWLTSAAARAAAKGAGLQSADIPEYLPAARAETRAGAPAPHAPWVRCDLAASW